MNIVRDSEIRPRGSDISDGTTVRANGNFSAGSTGDSGFDGRRGFPRGRGGWKRGQNKTAGAGLSRRSQRNKVFRTAATVAPENLRKLEVSLRTQVEEVATYVRTYVRTFVRRESSGGREGEWTILEAML